MTVDIDRANGLKIAKNYGAKGRPLPAAMATDPAYVAAHDQGRAANNQYHPLIPATPPATEMSTASARNW